MDWATPTALLFEHVGETASYSGATGSVIALVRPDIDRDFTAFETIRTDQTVIEMLTSQCGGVDSVQRGEIITIGGSSFEIDRVESDNGLITRVVCSDYVSVT